VICKESTSWPMTGLRWSRKRRAELEAVEGIVCNWPALNPATSEALSLLLSLHSKTRGTADDVSGSFLSLCQTRFYGAGLSRNGGSCSWRPNRQNVGWNSSSIWN
jgi:hypothetical protein